MTVSLTKPAINCSPSGYIVVHRERYMSRLNAQKCVQQRECTVGKVRLGIPECNGSNIVPRIIDLTSKTERQKGNESHTELEEVSRYVYVVVVCRVYVRGVSTRASAGATAMGRRRERRPHRKRASARSPAGHLRVEPLAPSRPAALRRETGSRSRSSVRGDTTGLRPDVEIRYGASVGILASQLLRHCATHTTSSCVSVRVRIWTAVHVVQPPTVHFDFIFWGPRNKPQLLGGDPSFVEPSSFGRIKTLRGLLKWTDSSELPERALKEKGPR